MKVILFITLSICSLNFYGQCVDCTSFEEAMKNPQKVKSLKVNPWLHNITLDSIPNSIGLMINLEILYLAGHEFSTIPKEIGNLTKLKELSLAECELKKLPDELFTLTNLKEIILLNNPFTDNYKVEIKRLFKEKMPNTKVVID